MLSARAIVLALASFGVAATVAPGSQAASPLAATGDDDGELIAEDAWVKFKLTHAGKTHAHPGYLGLAGEEMIQSMDSAAGTHEVSITLALEDDGKWSAKVTYKVAGKVLLTGDKAIRSKQWISFGSEDGKSKVQLHVDPDADGGEDIEVGKGQGPLDGLQ